MARDILAIPMSSVASESAFSLSKKVITPNRSSLKPKTVEALMCLHDWYRCKMQKKAEIEKKNKLWLILVKWKNLLRTKNSWSLSKVIKEKRREEKRREGEMVS